MGVGEQGVSLVDSVLEVDSVNDVVVIVGVVAC